MKNIRIYDNGGKTWDRYTVIFMDRPERQHNTFECLGMSGNPFSPQGYCEHSSAMPGCHIGRRIKFEQLPYDCQKALRQEMEAICP